jgi:hypothetical protein
MSSEEWKDTTMVDCTEAYTDCTVEARVERDFRRKNRDYYDADE